MLDPFRVLVFYPQSQSIVILNNAIAEISKPIYLRDKGLIDVSLVCRSSKGGIWVLDRTSWAIIYFDSGFNRTGETMIPDMTYSGSKPMFMQEKNQILYIAFQGKGICRFDSFGARLGDIPAEVDTFFTLNDNTIIYSTGGKLYQYSLENNQIIDFNSPCSCIPAIVQGKFLIFDGSRLVVCKIR